MNFWINPIYIVSNINFLNSRQSLVDCRKNEPAYDNFEVSRYFALSKFLLDIIFLIRVSGNPERYKVTA